MKAQGEFKIEDCIEMAWMMGHIKYFNDRLKDSSLHVGWFGKDVHGHYEKETSNHSGVHLIGTTVEFYASRIVHDRYSCRT
jgi:fatty acid synthase subunit alpha